MAVVIFSGKLSELDSPRYAYRDHILND